MTTIVEDLGTVLDATPDFASGTDLFGSTMPEEPDTVTSLTLTPPVPPIDVFTSALPPIERPRVQVLCRAKHPATAEAKARAAYVALAGIAEGIVSGGSKRTLRVFPESTPFKVGVDANDRTIFGFTVMAWRDA